MTHITLVGYHFPKTGGTSIHAHAGLHLDSTRHYGFGVFHDTRRLYGCMPLLAELDEDRAGKLNFVYGHGVNFSTLSCLPANSVELFTVCRDPVERFVSAYKHHMRYRREVQPLSVRAFFESQRASQFSQEMMTRFAPLADTNANTDEEKLVSILRGMRFVMATNFLNEQSVSFFGTIGLPPLSWKRRAYNEEIDLQGLTTDEIIERDHLDMMVYEAVSAAAASKDVEENPFGYQGERLAAARRSCAEGAGGQQSRIDAAYERLFNFLFADGQIHAVKLFLDQAGRSSARRAFAAFCANRSLDMSLQNLSARNWCFVSEMYAMLGDRVAQRNAAEAALTAQPDYPRANYLAGREAARASDFDRAVHLLSTAIKLNRAMPEAWYWLARVNRKCGDLETAKTSIDMAVHLSPDTKRYRDLRETISQGHGRRRALRPQDA